MREIASIDRLLVSRMLVAARDARQFVHGRERADLDADRLLLYALGKALEDIGEAASKTSAALRAEYAQIPWPSLIGLRHRLVHAFHDTDEDLLWDAVRNHLQPLIADLEKLLDEENQP